MSEYKFHEKNEILLDKLVKLATKDRIYDGNENIIYQSHLLTLFSNVLYKSPDFTLNITSATQKPQDVVDLISSDEEEQNLTANKTLNTSITHPACTQIRDYFNYVLDSLESDDDSSNLSLNDFKLILSYSTQELEKLFHSLAEQLSWNGIRNLCTTLCKDELYNLEHFEMFIRLFCTKLILPKLVSVELPRDLEIGLIKLLKKAESTIICDVLIVEAVFLEHDNWRLLNALCEELTDGECVLRRIIEKCNKLEDQHLELLNTLYQSNCSNNLKRSFIEFLCQFSLQFSESKMFGKLFLKVVKSLSSSDEFLQLEHILFSTVENNKTIFKGSCLKILTTLFRS